MTNAFQVSQAIHVAATLGIADLLQEGPRAVADLATSTGTSPAALRRLLRALASVGIFQEAEGDFAQTPLSEQLRSDLPGSVHAWALLIGPPYFWTSWDHLLTAVRTGRTALEEVHGTTVWEYRASIPTRMRSSMPR
jgi:hypothetical protein